jgi:hypothetical protein
MGTLDDLTEVFLDFLEFVDLDPQETVDRLEETQEPTEVLAIFVEAVNPTDEAAAVVVDVFEENVVGPVQQQGHLNPDNIEILLDQVEGNAAAILFGTISAAIIAEVGTFGQVDEVPAEIFQAVASLGIEDVTGREIDARLNEGIDPALKQKVHAEHRSKQADFQDFVEANLRQKATDPDIDPRDTPAGEGIESLLHPDDLGYLAEPEEYGTRPGQEGLYEIDGLNVNEPEEIIEEPIQYGIPVPLRPVEQITELAGQPEDVKEIYREVIDQLPKTENLLQDYARLTEFNFRLREKVQAGAFSAETALRVIEPELRDLIVNALPDDRYRPEDRTADEVVTELSEELGRNFALLESIPSDPPTFSDIERAYREGVISRRRYRQLYDEFGPQPFFIEEKIRLQDIRTGADDIARQEVLGRLTTSQAQNKLESIGFNPDQIAEILSGADPDEVVAQARQQRSSVSEVPLSSIPGIGENRALGLNVAGIESIEDLANASVEEVATNARVGNDQATRFIQIAQGVLDRAV